MIDFSALALGPAIAAFGRPVTVTPSKPPGAQPFPASGVWGSRNVDVATDDDGVLNTRVLTLGIRLAEWPQAPRQGWRLDVPAAGSLPAEDALTIDDIDLDGQGGAMLTLKRAQGPAR